MEASGVNKNASAQVYFWCAVCLVVGIACGYFIRGSAQKPAPQPVASQPQTTAVAAQPTPEMIKQMADKQAEPLLAQLKTTPNDPQLLAKVGNVYYNAQIYPVAISYYTQSLRLKDDPDVRTDMGTAIYYSGDADAAIAEFEKTLKAFPKSPNALFNIGMVKWQSKMDTDGAVVAWQKLLKENPNLPRKAEVEQLIARARQHSTMVAPSKAKGSM